MIASYGGATIDANGNRNFPGSGGMVGALSEPGRGNSYIGGAGPVYYQFTPGHREENPGPPVDNCLTGICDPPGPIFPPPPPPPPGDPNEPPPGVPCIGGSCDPLPPEVGTGTIGNLLNGLLRRNTPDQNTSGPVYLFTPQPGETGGGPAIDPKTVLLFGAVVIAGIVVYKKVKG